MVLCLQVYVEAVSLIFMVDEWNLPQIHTMDVHDWEQWAAESAVVDEVWNFPFLF